MTTRDRFHRLFNYVPALVVIVAWGNAESLGSQFALGGMAAGALWGATVSYVRARRDGSGAAFVFVTAITAALTGTFCFLLATAVAILLPPLLGRAPLQATAVVQNALFAAAAMVCVACSMAPTMDFRLRRGIREAQAATR